jgi:hypothetical protein
MLFNNPHFISLSPFPGILQPLRFRRDLNWDSGGLPLPTPAQTHNIAQPHNRIRRNRPHFGKHHLLHHFRYDRIPTVMSTWRGNQLAYYLVDNQWVVDMNDSEIVAVDNFYIVSFDE